jgi:hypothetical protein
MREALPPGPFDLIADAIALRAGSSSLLDGDLLGGVFGAGCGAVGEFSFDAFVDAGLGEFARHSDSVHDGALVAGAVADDADAADA